MRFADFFREDKMTATPNRAQPQPAPGGTHLGRQSVGAIARTRTLGATDLFPLLPFAAKTVP
jgi:hypothetical protein